MADRCGRYVVALCWGFIGTRGVVSTTQARDYPMREVPCRYIWVAGWHFALPNKPTATVLKSSGLWI